jgi:hypothetical protein
MQRQELRASARSSSRRVPLHARHAALGLGLWLAACGGAPASSSDGGDAGTGADRTAADGPSGGGDGTGSDGASGDAGDAGPTRPPPTVCNGEPSLCAKRYNEVAYPTTHNAMSAIEWGFRVPNQRHPMDRQLADGVRAMMLDTWYDGQNPRTRVPSFCHVGCTLGKISMADGLAIIRTFMEQNPDEVLSLLIENHISNQDTAQAFQDAGLVDVTFTHTLGDPWPTLSEMIQSGRKLVVYAETMGGDPAWYHDLYAIAAETPYDFQMPSDFSCRQNRGLLKNELFLINHFLTGPSEMLADEVNHNPLLIDRAQQCQQERGMFPNFLAVDFYEIGDLFAAVRTLNGL